MSKNIVRDYERIRIWRKLIEGSAGIEDLKLKVDVTGGVHMFPLSKRVVRELVCGFYDIDRWGRNHPPSDGASAISSRQTFFDIIAQTDWFDPFFKYMVYICRGYLDPTENGWDRGKMVADDVRPQLSSLVSVMESKLNEPDQLGRHETIHSPWAEDVPPVCLSEDLADPFASIEEACVVSAARGWPHPLQICG